MSDDPREIENDLERTRERLGENLNALTDRMSPGNLLDEAMTYFEGSPKDFANTLGTQVKRNPMATMMVTAGLAWLSLGKGEQPGSDMFRSRGSYDWDDDDDDDDDDYHEARRRSASYPSDYATSNGMGATSAPGTYSRFDNDDEYAADREADRAAISSYDRIESVRSRVMRQPEETPTTYYSRLDTAHGEELGYTREAGEDDATYRDRVREGVEAARERADTARIRMRDAARNARRSARDMQAQAYERAQMMSEAGRDRAVRLKHDAQDFHMENPLVSGFIAMAAGALAGAVLPTSQQERDALEPLAREAEKHGVKLAEQAREHGERYAEQAREHGERLADKAEQKAMQVSEAAADQAERLASKAESYGDRVRTEASQAGKG